MLTKRQFSMPVQRPASLHDTESLLVYGDWLQEQGDPRGMLIAVQHALTVRASSELVLLEADLLRTHRPDLLGAALAGEFWDGRYSPRLRLKWRLGFIDVAWLYPRRNCEELLQTVLDSPSSSLIRKLDIEPTFPCSRLAAILASRSTTTLETLSIGTPRRHGVQRGLRMEAAELFDVCPTVERVDLAGVDMYR